MRRILIATGVLGGGTALVFGAAAVASILIPPSRIVPQPQNIMFDRGVPTKIELAPAVGMGIGGADIVVDLPAPEETR